jgi:protein SCO1/2
MIRRWSVFVLVFTACHAAWAMQAVGQPEDRRPPLPLALRDVGIDQRLNDQAPLDLVFRDETGASNPLSTFFGRRPVVLALVYYQCPMLCTQILNGLVSSLRSVSFTAGSEYDVVAVSIDPTETPQLALSKQKQYVKRYARGPGGWHFLTGEEPQIRRLAKAVGFRYHYDPQAKQYAHASAVMVLTPQGRLSRYLYGVDYATRDLRLALVEASENRIGTPVDQILLFCYHYDPITGKYGAAAMRLMRFAGITFVVILSTFLFFMWRRDLRRDMLARAR